MMSRAVTGLAAAGALVLNTMSALAQELPPCRSRSINVEHGNRAARSKAGVSFICAQGSLTRIHLETRRTTIAAVLSAIRASYNISYHSSIALDETRDGVYVGSLREVISRLLSNYNYVIKSENSTLDVDIFGKSGELAVAAQMTTEVKAQPERPAHGARTH